MPKFFISSREPIFILTKPLEYSAKNTQPSEFLDMMYPFLSFWRLIGRFPCVLEGRELKYRIYSLWNIYSAIIILFQTFITFYFSPLMNLNPTYFDENLVKGICFINYLFHASTPAIIWYEVPTVTKYFRKWNQVEDTLGYEGMSLKSKLKKWPKVVNILIIPYVLGASFTECWIIGHYLFFPVFCMVQLNICITLYMWLFTCCSIYFTANELHKHTLKVINKQRLKRQEVFICRRNWLLLSELTSEVGFFLGPTVLLNIILATLVLIGASYAIILIIRDGFEHSWWFTLLMLVIFLLGSCVLLAFCEISQRVTNSVGLCFKKSIIRCNFSKFDSEIETELNIFLKTIERAYPDISLCGYVTIGRGLFFSLLSASVAYLIVLIQFRTANDVAFNHLEVPY